MSLDKGLDLERKVHQYLLYKGYLVRPRIKLVLEPYSEENLVTDIDLFGIKIDTDLHLKKAYFDCKHQESGFAQILKIIGVREILNVEECVGIRERITREVRYFANDNSIKLMEKSFFDKLKDEIKIGSCSTETYEKTQNFLSVLKEEKNREIKRNLFFTLQRTILIKNPFLRFKRIREILNLILEKIENKKNNKFLLHWLLFDTYELVNFTIIEMAINLDDCPKNYLKTEIETRLKEDYFSERKKNEISKSLKNLSEKLKKLGVSVEKLNFDTAPEYLMQLTQLVSNILYNKNLIQKMLLVNNYLTYGFLIHNKSPDKKYILDKTGINEEQLKIISKINSIAAETICSEKKHIIKFNPYF